MLTLIKAFMANQIKEPFKPDQTLRVANDGRKSTSSASGAASVLGHVPGMV